MARKRIGGPAATPTRFGRGPGDAARGKDLRIAQGTLLVNGVDQGPFRRINLVQGANVTLTVGLDADGATSVTVASSGGGSGAWTEVRKAVDESRLSTTTFVADDELVVPLAASTRYHIRGLVRFTTASAADIKFQVSGPSGATRLAIQRWAIAAGATAFSAVEIDKAYASPFEVLGSSDDGSVNFDILVENGTTAGDLTIDWAQANSVASNTTVLRGSLLEWRTW